MKKIKLSLFLTTIVAMAIIVTSCGKKLGVLDASMFDVNPSPLEMVGNKVPVTITGKIPAKWFHKNAVIVVTPVLKYDGKESVGQSYTYQGENVAGNGQTVSYSNGATLTMNNSFDYVPEMKKSELYLRFNVSMKGKSSGSFPDLKVANGVMSTAALASLKSTTPSIAPDAYQRIIKEQHDASIMFLIQQAELRSSELRSGNLDAGKNLVAEANSNDRKNIDVEIMAYASPDGGLELNEKLAERREKNTNQYLSKEFQKSNIGVGINAKYTAQDWDGFQKLVQASNLQDKDLVLRVLSMYTDPERREKEIKNVSVVYKDLAETILPQLRRSRLIANVEVVGKSKEEIISTLGTNAGELSLEELLYAGTFEEVSAESVYKFATEKYPSDYRAWNNLATEYLKQGDLSKAKTTLEKARSISAGAKEVNANLGLLALANNDLSQAETLLGKASGASGLNEALGLMYIKKGDYKAAEKAFGDNVKSNNAALAQLMNKDYSKAQKTLNAVKNQDGTTHYLAAIISARTNDTSGVLSNLNKALDSGFSGLDMLEDSEFSKYVESSALDSLFKK